jgi:hypothetical protein
MYTNEDVISQNAAGPRFELYKMYQTSSCNFAVLLWAGYEIYPSIVLAIQTKLDGENCIFHS